MYTKHMFESERMKNTMSKIQETVGTNREYKDRLFCLRFGSEEYKTDMLSLYNAINGKVNEEYLAILYNDGYNAYSNQDYKTAIENFLKAVELDISYQNGNALYYLAQSYRKNGDLESAKPYYTKFIEMYPNTERAATAARYAE